jgi:AcrR family transcriptional regulator
MAEEAFEPDRRITLQKQELHSTSHPMSEAAAKARSAKASLYRALVVDAAEHLFATRGYERTKIQDIASSSGLSLGTLYSVFDGKADVLEAIHDERLGELFGLAAGTMATDERAAERLMQGNRVFIRWLTEHPDFLRIHLGNSAWASNPTGASEGQIDAWRRGIELIASVIQLAMDEGDACEGDPILSARLMVAMQQVFMSAWVESGMRENPEALGDRIEAQIRRSLFRSTK